MSSTRRVVYADDIKQMFDKREADDVEMYGGVHIIECFPSDDAKEIVDKAPTAEVIEVNRINEVKQEILGRLDDFIADYSRFSVNPYHTYGAKVEAMEVARRLVNAALTDLCKDCSANTDGGNEDV